MAGLPEDRLLQPDGERFLSLEKRLGGRIVGHEHNLSTIARAVRRNYAGFSAQRPLASFLFCGPSGVGKTETARALADELFDGDLVRIEDHASLPVSEADVRPVDTLEPLQGSLDHERSGPSRHPLNGQNHRRGAGERGVQQEQHQEDGKPWTERAPHSIPPLFISFMSFPTVP